MKHCITSSSIQNFFLLSAAYFFAATAHALDDSDCGQLQLERIFRESFSDSSCYRFGECLNNVGHLLERFKAQGLDISQGRVLLLKHEKVRLMGPGGPPSEAALRPKHMRQEGVGHKTFFLHYVLELNGAIYDLDYKPSPHAVSDYVTKQWARNEQSGDPNDVAVPARIDLVVIPAPEFLALFPDEASLPPGTPRDAPRRMVHEAIKDRSGRDFPQMSLQQFVDGGR